MSAPGYVGELWAVSVGGWVDLVEVQRVALGVDGSGLVTAETRAELAQGVIYDDPGARRIALDRIWYHRKRKGAAWWYHETPGALVELVNATTDGEPPFAWLDSTGSVLCGAENFVCE